MTGRYIRIGPADAGLKGWRRLHDAAAAGF
ncbi:hypothetical protein QFZ47_004426 [Variovorax paradoxus]|nr:hypothetical protein [Variovorax paradoxus]